MSTEPWTPQYRMPYSPLFNGAFLSMTLRNSNTTYTARIFTADPERVFLGQIILTTTGAEPTIGQIESAIRESARGLDAATLLNYNMRRDSPEMYRIHIAPLYSEPSTSGEN